MKKRIRDLEIKIRKNIELNEQFQASKKQSQAEMRYGDVIRRRKGEQDKRIFRKFNRPIYEKLE